MVAFILILIPEAISISCNLASICCCSRVSLPGNGRLVGIRPTSETDVLLVSLYPILLPVTKLNGLELIYGPLLLYLLGL